MGKSKYDIALMDKVEVSRLVKPILDMHFELQYLLEEASLAKARVELDKKLAVIEKTLSLIGNRNSRIKEKSISNNIKYSYEENLNATVRIREFVHKTRIELNLKITRDKDYNFKVSKQRTTIALIAYLKKSKRIESQLLNFTLLSLFKLIGNVGNIETLFRRFPNLRPSQLPNSFNYQQLKNRIYRAKHSGIRKFLT